jgi:two-component system, cell cycle response regulator
LRNTDAIRNRSDYTSPRVSGERSPTSEGEVGGRGLQDPASVSMRSVLEAVPMPRLLLVEDEQVNRDLFRRRLERKGYAVVPAETGHQAVELARSEKPDLVLMDLGLPDIDGWEATRRIKADPATAAIPVIVLSAHTSAEARAQAFAAGCEDFEVKPVDWEALFAKIEEALRKAEERAKARAAPPANDEIDLGGAGSDSTATRVIPARAAPGQARILVVEDNDANRVMLCRRLLKHGYATTEAADGRQALDAVRREPFDLVLCDIMMPGVDGYEVLKEMKADPELRAIPVVMISAVDEMASIVRCIEMGAEDYLQKPYDPVLLQARITACLDRRRLCDRERADRRAIADLTHAVAMVEQGTFDPASIAAVTARTDELGELARAFEKMARAVQGLAK